MSRPRRASIFAASPQAEIHITNGYEQKDSDENLSNSKPRPLGPFVYLRTRYTRMYNLSECRMTRESRIYTAISQMCVHKHKCVCSDKEQMSETEKKRFAWKTELARLATITTIITNGGRRRWPSRSSPSLSFAHSRVFANQRICQCARSSATACSAVIRFTHWVDRARSSASALLTLCRPIARDDEHPEKDRLRHLFQVFNAIAADFYTHSFFLSRPTNKSPYEFLRRTYFPLFFTYLFRPFTFARNILEIQIRTCLAVIWILIFVGAGADVPRTMSLRSIPVLRPR